MDKLRKRALKNGYACDFCGRELFDYPLHRFCAACEEKLPRTANPCPKCGREGVSNGLCLDCKEAPPAYERGFSPFLYRGEGSLLINRMKNGELRLAAYLGERMGEYFLWKAGAIDGVLLIAVPTTKERLRERGYNQAELLADGVNERLSDFGVRVEVDYDVLQRVRERAQQKKVSKRERRENIRGAFRVRKRKTVVGKTVLLVDDILTTGATGSECARKLLAAGAKKVYFLTAVALPEPK